MQCLEDMNKMGNDENIYRTKIPNTCMNTEDSIIVENIQVMVNFSNILYAITRLTRLHQTSQCSTLVQ